MKYSARFTANTRVIRYVVIKDRKTDVFVPQSSPLACLNLQCLFDLHLFERALWWRALE